MIIKHAAIGRTRAAGALAFSVVASVSVLAACAVTSEPEVGPPPAGPPVISAEAGPIFNEAIERLGAQDYAGAGRVMSALDLDSLTPYERSRAEQVLFQSAYGSGNYEEARAHLEASLATGALGEEDASALRYQIAQSYMVEERWADGARTLEAWIRNADSPNGAAYYLLAVAYYQQEDYAKALPNAERAVEASDAPQESWLQLLVALYIQQERLQDAAPVLERLLVINPDDKNYWAQLASVYAVLGMTAEGDALVARAPAEFLPLAPDPE